MKFKACLHLHINQDPIETIGYSAKQAIKTAQKKGFSILSFTCHDKCVDIKPYLKYAKSKGILLISGIEKTIEGKHVLILNCDQQTETIQTFQQLKKYKKNNPQILIIAPHPFFPTKECLNKKLIQHSELFDAIEFSYCYHKLMNFNNKAVKISQQQKIPLVATSDVHFLEYIDYSYTYINSEKLDINSVITAIKQNSIAINTKSFSFLGLIHLLYKMFTLPKKNVQPAKKSLFRKSL